MCLFAAGLWLNPELHGCQANYLAATAAPTFPLPLPALLCFSVLQEHTALFPPAKLHLHEGPSMGPPQGHQADLDLDSFFQRSVHQRVESQKQLADRVVKFISIFALTVKSSKKENVQ